MKQTLTIILMVMAGVAWGETNKIYVVDNLPITLAPTQSPTNEMKAVSLSLMTDTNGPGRTTTTPEYIRELASSGKICEAMGFHCWEPYNSPSVLKQPLQRKCKLCGKVETKTVEWK